MDGAGRGTRLSTAPAVPARRGPDPAQRPSEVAPDGPVLIVRRVAAMAPKGSTGRWGTGRARRRQSAVDAGGPAFAVGGVAAQGPQAPAARRDQDGDHGGPRPCRLLRGSRHAPAGGTGRPRRPIRRITVSGDTEARTGGASGRQGVDHDDQGLREGRQAGRVRVAVPEAVFEAAHEGFRLIVEPAPATGALAPRARRMHLPFNSSPTPPAAPSPSAFRLIFVLEKTSG